MSKGTILVLFLLDNKQAMDNKQAEHEASIIEIDGKLCHQVISILIDPRSNYIYVSHNLADQCGLNKELHADS